MRERIKKSMLVLAVGVCVNIALAIVKMYVGLSSNSLTIIMDATNNFFDIATCFITIAAFVFLLRPRTTKAPFGYGRTEYLASFIVAVVTAVVGGMFFMQSLNRMAMPEPVWFGLENCILITVAVPVKLGLALFYYFVNKKLRSKAIAALVLDSFLDTGITLTALVTFAISDKVDYAVDAIVGMVLSVVIIVFAVKMIVDGIKAVTVGDGAREEREEIERLCNEQDAVSSVKNTVLHDYGYASKTGEVELEFCEGTDPSVAEEICGKLSVELERETGAQVRFFAYKERECFETSKQDDEQND